jgi:F-type H+-transporting ATPase subunit delta
MSDRRVEGYAAAILEIAEAEDQLERLEEELFQVARVVESSTELADRLGDRRIPVERRQAIVEELISPKASPLTLTLIELIIGAERTRDLAAIVDGFIAKAAAKRRRAVAEIRSAIPLNDEMVARLERALGVKTGKQVEVKVVVDPSVVGGISARVGDVVIDGTVRSRLEKLRQALQAG